MYMKHFLSLYLDRMDQGVEQSVLPIVKLKVQERARWRKVTG